MCPLFLTSVAEAQRLLPSGNCGRDGLVSLHGLLTKQPTSRETPSFHLYGSRAERERHGARWQRKRKKKLQILQKLNELRGRGGHITGEIREEVICCTTGLTGLFNELCLGQQLQFVLILKSKKKEGKKTPNFDHCFLFEGAHDGILKVFVCAICLPFQAE